MKRHCKRGDERGGGWGVTIKQEITGEDVTVLKQRSLQTDRSGHQAKSLFPKK